MQKPFVIGIGGAHSGVGKTTLSALIIKHLTQHLTYPFSRNPRLCAIKYTKTKLYSAVIEDEALIRQQDKDTDRLSAAGAEKVLWINSTYEDLETLLSMALLKLADFDGIIIEGNSAIEFAKPDIVIFLCGEPKENTKASAESLIKQADIVIARQMEYAFVYSAINNKAKFFILKDYPYVFDDTAIKGIISLMEKIEKNKEIEHLLKEKAVDGKISCTAARRIAEDLNVPYRDVGSTANELKIKINKCELGCF